MNICYTTQSARPTYLKKGRETKEQEKKRLGYYDSKQWEGQSPLLSQKNPKISNAS
jgi:hypothetical protein